MINLRRYLSTIKLPLTKPTTSRLNSKGKTKVPDQAPTPLSHLPPEIWLIIFSYEDTLTPADIRSIRLTSHFFSILSCARIFKKYYFDPFSCDGDEDINSEREEEMAFFTSELIAPCIKECILGPTSSLRVNQTIDEDHLNPLITHFFNTLLPKFVSLLAFTAKWIPFNDLALEKLCGMRGTLRVLDVDDCIVNARTLAPVERLGKLEVTNLTIRSAIHAPGPRDRGSVGWLEVLDLSHVKHIRVKVDNPELSHLRGFTTTSTPDPFSSSSSLEQTNAFFETLALLLKPAYNLETLHIKRFYSCREDIPLPAFTLIFPKLRTYRGPQRLFERIKPGSELRSLTLKSFEAHKYHKPEDVERILTRTKEDGMRIGERLVELVVNVNGVPEGFLESIERECGRLRVLSIRAAQLDEEMVRTSHLLI